MAVGYVSQFAMMDRRFPISVWEVVLISRSKSGLCSFMKYSELDKEMAYEQLQHVGIEKLVN